MDDFIAYLEGALGLRVSSEGWDAASAVPLFLSAAADYDLCRCGGTEFLAAAPKGGQSLPDLKRIPAQMARFTDLPVVLVSGSIDPRQRRALTAQGIAFCVPGRQAYLPFLALAAKSGTERRSYGGRLTPRGQAALVTIIANPGIATAKELRGVSGIGASTASRAIDELAQLGLIERGKDGRNVVFDYDRGKNALLRESMPLLSSPVARTVFARRGPALDALPDAGETALSARSMLAPPPVAQKAASRAQAARLEFDEVLEGELPDGETIELQVWAYDPLVAGLGRVDDISLGASLAGLGDERIGMELDALFGEEGLWQ